MLQASLVAGDLSEPNRIPVLGFYHDDSNPTEGTQTLPFLRKPATASCLQLEVVFSAAEKYLIMMKTHGWLSFIFPESG